MKHTAYAQARNACMFVMRPSKRGKGGSYNHMINQVVKDDNFGEGNIHLFKDSSGNLMVSSDLANYTGRNYQNTDLGEVHRQGRKVAV